MLVKKDRNEFEFACWTPTRAEQLSGKEGRAKLGYGLPETSTVLPFGSHLRDKQGIRTIPRSMAPVKSSPTNRAIQSEMVAAKKRGRSPFV